MRVWSACFMFTETTLEVKVNYIHQLNQLIKEYDPFQRS